MGSARRQQQRSAWHCIIDIQNNLHTRTHTLSQAQHITRATFPLPCALFGNGETALSRRIFLFVGFQFLLIGSKHAPTPLGRA